MTRSKKDLIGYAAYIFWWWRWAFLSYAVVAPTVAGIFLGLAGALCVLAGAVIGMILVTALTTYYGWKETA